MLRLLAFVLPLGLDSFAVAAAIGALQVTTVWQRLRISLVFVIFEGGMPLIGLALGSALANSIGPVADYLAAGAVIAIGAWMALTAEKDDEEKASRLASSHGLALIALGISISLDELAIGFSIGLAIGARIGERWRERAERVAGIALILLGAYLIARQLIR